MMTAAGISLSILASLLINTSSRAGLIKYAETAVVPATTRRHTVARKRVNQLSFIIFISSRCLGLMNDILLVPIYNNLVLRLRKKYTFLFYVNSRESGAPSEAHALSSPLKLPAAERTGNLHRKEYHLFLICSLTPPQAAGMRSCFSSTISGLPFSRD
jgi:hypothetical protein